MDKEGQIIQLPLPEGSQSSSPRPKEKINNIGC